MMLLYLLAAGLIIAGIALLLDLTPERITEDLTRIITPTRSLRDHARLAQGKKKSRKITSEFISIQQALKFTGKTKSFTLVCAASLFMCVGGIVLTVFIGNLFLLPILSVVMACAPFFHIKASLALYKRQIDEELETALSIVSTAYVRSDSIVIAVRENIVFLRPPLQSMFNEFLSEITIINSDIKGAIHRLRGKINNSIYHEWCDCLLQCQDDRSFKTSLMPIVKKLSEVRIVNYELHTILAQPKKHYITMAIMVISNIPLLYMINDVWYNTLMYSTPGKLVLAIGALVIVVTLMLMIKFTKPLEYKR